MAAPVAPVVEPVTPAAPVLTGTERIRETIANLRATVTDGAIRIPEPVVDPAAAPIVDPAAPVVPVAAPPAATPATPDTAITETPIVMLRAAQEGAAALEIQLPDVESANLLRSQLRNAGRVEQMQREVAVAHRDSRDSELMLAHIKADSVGFLLETVPEANQIELALAILAKNGMAGDTRATIEKWLDGAEGELERRQFKLDLDTRLAQTRDSVTATVTAQLGAKEASRAVAVTVDNLVPLVPANLQGRFEDDLLRDMQEFYQRRPEIGVLRPGQIARILQQRLAIYGIQPEQVAQRLNPNASAGVPVAKPTGEVAERLAAQVAAAKDTGNRLVAQRVDRSRVAAVPAAGGGATPAEITPPPKQKMEERISWLRKIGVGRR